MSSSDLGTLEGIIETAFENRDGVNTSTKGEIRDAVETSLNLLDAGEARVAEREANGNWKVNQWLKKAVLLSFRLNDMEIVTGGPGESTWWDKVPSKFENWGENQFRAAGFRAVPNAVVRHSAYVAKNVVLMPSFVNLGAYVDEGTMVDTWATRRLLRADRQARPSFRRRRHWRRARAAPGWPHHHRRQLLHRRALRSRRRLHHP